MCRECGCGYVPGDVIDDVVEQVRAQSITGQGGGGLKAVHDHGPDHQHPHEHVPDPGPPPVKKQEPQTIEIDEAILGQNDRLAERNRGYFKAKGWLVLNVLSSPGSGKTTLLQKTVARLHPRLRCGVIVGDLATDNDAKRLSESGAPVVQITTGTVCHLEAVMVAKALERLNTDGLDVLIIENVGNLVCPAVFDLGEDLRVVLLSTTEGEDKPLKYPPMFHSAQAAVINKIDLASAVDFDRELALSNLKRMSPGAQIFELSARTGQGLDEWCEYLVTQHARRRGLTDQ